MVLIQLNRCIFISEPTDKVKKIQRLNISVVLNNECSQFGGLHVDGEKPNTDSFLCALNPPMPLYQVTRLSSYLYLHIETAIITFINLYEGIEHKLHFEWRRSGLPAGLFWLVWLVAVYPNGATGNRLGFTPQSVSAVICQFHVLLLFCYYSKILMTPCVFYSKNRLPQPPAIRNLHYQCTRQSKMD